MFGKRRTSQKPDESFIRDFQRQFGSVASRSYSPQISFQGATDHDVSQDDHSAVNFLSPITRQNCSCSVLGNRMCTVLHSPAGDLHTPAHECNASIWGNRISNFDPPQDDSLAGSGTGSGNPLQSDSRYPNHPFQTVNPVFSELTDSPEPILRRHSEYDSLGLMPGNLFPQGTVDPLQITSLPVEMASDWADLSHSNTNMEPRRSLPQDSEVAFDRDHLARTPESPSLRYRVTLHAPTATFHQTREIPVTYLNRCQPYLISVTDTRPPAFRAQPTRYRTYVRISFDNAAQREDPVSSWRLWRDGRGLHEARKRDGRLSAVEFVNVRNDGFRSEGAAHVQLLSSSFDGFCVQWTVDPHAVRVGCEMHVAFNCLSTDFSLSKGVKGAALRLCAKTELVSVDQAPLLMAHQPNVPEICYCKVKVFRDHGAERKLSNDTIHLRRAIRKMEEKIAEAEFYNTKAPGKKKRVRTRAYELLDSVDAEPGGSSSSSSGSRVPRRAHSFSTGENLYQELFDLRKVFSSSQPTSVLSLRGTEQDDPDLFPVELSSGATSPRTLGRPGTQSELPSEMNTDEWMEMLHDEYSAQSEATQSSIQTPANDPGGTLENVNVPIRSRPGQGKAVACFYVLSRHDGQTDEYYRALYLMERTVSNLESQLSKVRDTTAEHIARLIRINPAGLRIMIDDTVVQEIPEGQDMIAEFREGDGVDIAAEDFEVALFF